MVQARFFVKGKDIYTIKGGNKMMRFLISYYRLSALLLVCCYFDDASIFLSPF